MNSSRHCLVHGPPEKRTEGFTLIELLIVIAIIGILAGLLIPSLLAAQQRSYDTGAQACAKSIESAQGLAQIDFHTYMPIGAGAGKINRDTDGVNAACKVSTMYFKDRSDTTALTKTYTFDVWDKRGNKTFTLTPTSLQADVSGATAFSGTGAGGANLP